MHNSLPFSVPPWVAVRAKKRAPLVRVGMTDAQVWSTLGLAGRGFRAHISGSGPAGAYPANYVLWPGYVMHMRWDLRTKPATLVEFKFRDHSLEELQAALGDLGFFGDSGFRSGQGVRER